MVGTERWGDADNQIMSLRSDFLVHCRHDAGINILRGSFPSAMRDCERFMDGIVENRSLTVSMADRKPKIFFRCKERVCSWNFFAVLGCYAMDVGSMCLMRKDDLGKAK